MHGIQPASLQVMMNENVGNQIIGQIRSLDKWALGAWGCTFTSRAHTPSLTENGVVIPYSFGPRRTGWVTIKLDAGTDTYSVMVDRKDRKLVISRVRDAEGVYAEDLVRVIDSILKEVQA